MGFENLDVELFTAKFGGRFLAASLVQKRIRELERGWPVLVPVEGRDIMQVALEEFRQGKIWLVSGAEADKLRDARMIEERERARAVEAARRAAEEAAGLSSGGQKTSLAASTGLAGVIGASGAAGAAGAAGAGRPAAPPA